MLSQVWHCEADLPAPVLLNHTSVDQTSLVCLCMGAGPIEAFNNISHFTDPIILRYCLEEYNVLIRQRSQCGLAYIIHEVFPGFFNGLLKPFIRYCIIFEGFQWTRMPGREFMNDPASFANPLSWGKGALSRWRTTWIVCLNSNPQTLSIVSRPSSTAWATV